MSAIAVDLPVGLVNIPGLGSMLIIGVSPQVAEPHQDGINLIKRRVAKRLGVAAHQFVKLPFDHPSFRADRIPMLGLRLAQFDHLTHPEAVRKTGEVLAEISEHVLQGCRANPSKTEKTRPTNRTSQLRSRKSEFH